MKTFYHLIFTAVVSALTGCALPDSGYYGYSPDQAEASRQFTAKLQRQDDDEANRNRKAEAEATEVATRHNPSSVSTSNTEVYAPTTF